MKRTLTISALVALALAVFAMSTLPAEAGRARSGRLFGAFPDERRIASLHQDAFATAADSDAHANSASDTNSESEPKPESEPNSESVAKPEPGPEPEPKPKSDTDSGASTKSWTDADSRTTSATNSVTLEEPAPLAGSFHVGNIFLTA